MAPAPAPIFPSGPEGGRRLALTFDDGPAASTGAVLDALAAAGAPATFFLIGGFVRGREELVRRIAAEGHEVAVHGQRHLNALVVRDRGALEAEYAECADELERALGERPRLVRPPYGGDAGRTALAAAAVGLGPVVLWTVLGFDWDDDDAGSIAARVLAEAHPGAIVCLHDGDRKDPANERAATVAALPEIVAGLRRDGYELVTVSELLA